MAEVPVNLLMAPGRTPMIGTALTLPGAALAELVAEAFDFVWIDLEHSPISVTHAVDLIIAAQAATAFAMIRLPVDAHQEMTVLLDAGIDGVVLADVADAAAARRAVSRIHYPPRGERGWGPRRLATRHRHGPNAPAPAVWAQVERPGAVDRADEIAAVDGIDALVVGTADLSWSLGKPLQFDAPELVEAVASVRVAALAADVALGIAGPLDVVPTVMLDGVGFLVHSTEARLAASAMDSAYQQIRARTRQHPSEAHG